MKVICLFTWMLCGCIAGAYAQYNQKFQQESPSTGYSVPEFVPRFNPNQKGREEVDPPDAIEGDTAATDKTLDQLELTQNYRMPCFIPQGNFAMLIHKPDSTIRYRMPIKRF